MRDVKYIVVTGLFLLTIIILILSIKYKPINTKDLRFIMFYNKYNGKIITSYVGLRDYAVVVINGGKNKEYKNSYIIKNFSIEKLAFTYGSGDYSIKIGEYIGYGRVEIIAEIPINVSVVNNISTFNGDGYYIQYTKEIRDIIKNTSKLSEQEYIEYVYNYVSNNIEYDDELEEQVRMGKIKIYYPDISEILKTKKAICIGKSSLMASMLRGRGIPVKIVTGYTYNSDYHAWIEVYTGGEWHLYDPTKKVTYKDYIKLKNYTITNYY